MLGLQFVTGTGKASTRRKKLETEKEGREGNFLMVVRLKNIIMIILEDVIYLYTSVGLLYAIINLLGDIMSLLFFLRVCNE